jgi:ferredoxin
MTHVVTQPCVGCRYTDCVVACVAECPVEAIFHEDNVPDDWKSYIELNAEMAAKSTVITEKKKPLADS